jgi:hypothetical protein
MELRGSSFWRARRFPWLDVRTILSSRVWFVEVSCLVECLVVRSRKGPVSEVGTLVVSESVLQRRRRRIVLFQAWTLEP